MMKINLTLCLALVASPVTATSSSDLDVARAHEMKRLVEDVLIDAELSSLKLGTNGRLSFDPTAVSLRNEPPILPGAPDPYSPPQR